MSDHATRRRWFRFSLSTMSVVTCLCAPAYSDDALAGRFPNAEYANALEKEMIEAAFKGNVEKVKDCLSKGARIDAREGEGRIFMRRGSWFGGSDNWTALMAAIDADQIEVARFLVSSKASVKVHDGWGRTPLCMLAQKEKPKKDYGELAALIIEKGANPNAKTGVYIDGPGDQTALHYAAMNGHAEIVKMLIAAGADVNAATSYGGTPLDYVTGFRNRPAIRDILLKAGARKGTPTKEAME